MVNIDDQLDKTKGQRGDTLGISGEEFGDYVKGG